MTNSKTPVSGDSSEAVRGALPYTQPKLTIYGSIKELTGGVSGTVGDAGVPTMPASDPVLKENIRRVGEHPAGFGLYLFDFKPEFVQFGAGRQFGVMADEVQAIVPDAVVRGPHGYLTVNYDLLGITRH